MNQYNVWEKEEAKTKRKNKTKLNKINRKIRRITREAGRIMQII